MEPLVPPDSHHVLAAQGWPELGNHVEANEEGGKYLVAFACAPVGL
jgi:hypothetical protein